MPAKQVKSAGAIARQKPENALEQFLEVMVSTRSVPRLN